jgi:ribonucleotide reductase alpha subunit
MENKNYEINEVLNSAIEYFKGDELSAKVWVNKYALKDSYGNIYEKTPDDMHWRLANELARIESKYPNPLKAEELFELIRDFKYIVPQGSPMSGIGNDFQISSISNCFVIGNNANSDSYGGIIKTDEEQVQLMKRRGGVGHDLSHIRPKGSPVKNSALTSTGIVPFMERYSNSTREVAQDGRRGALMLSVSVKHPDSEDFIDAKLEQGKITGANISVKIHDDFMLALTNKQKYIQQYPVNSITPQVLKEINTEKLWKKIIHNAWKSAEPGILFWDTIINESVADCYADLGFETVSTNPCLTDDTWVFTTEGPRQIKDLIGVQFKAITNNNIDDSTEEGFFYTDNKEVFKIKTKKGYTLKGTDNHKIKIAKKISRTKTETDWVEIKDLKIGDEIILNNNNHKWDGNGNFEIGWLYGNFIGDGNLSEDSFQLRYWGNNRMEMKEQAISYLKNNFQCRSDLGLVKNKESYDNDVYVIKSVELKNKCEEFGINIDKTFNYNIFEKNSYEFYRGFISGLLDADGTVSNNITHGLYVRLSTSNTQLLYLTQRMLSRLGIISTIYENRREATKKFMPDGKNGKKEYSIKPQHELNISKNNLLVFQKIINFTDENKKNKLNTLINSFNKRGLYRENFQDKIVSIESIGFEDVYDCQIIGSNQFDANGIIVHNCGELPLCPYDSCRLLAINLYSYVENPFTNTSKFNFELFKEHVIYAQRMMDDIVDIEIEKIDKILNKIESDPETDYIKLTEKTLWSKIKDKCETGRRTGVGITAEGDMLAALGYRYGTEEATAFSELVHKTLAIEVYRSSVIMAKERGSFKIYNTEKESNNPFINRLKKADPELYNDMTKYGRRNIACLTIAPTGTTSMMTQTTSGIEPVFMPVYTRRKKVNPNDKNSKVDFVDEVGDSWEEFNVFHHKFLVWMEVNGYDVTKKYSESEINEIIKLSPYFKATSTDIDWLEKVKMQGKIQKWVDHSISVTINLPSTATEELVSELYIEAWKSGCKGCTVYRDGSRSGVLVSSTEKKINNETSKIGSAEKRPKKLKCKVVRFNNGGEKWVSVVGLLNDKPYEIFTGLLDKLNIPNNIEEGWVIRNMEEKPMNDDYSLEEKKVSSRYDFGYKDKDNNTIIIEGLSTTFKAEYWNYAKLISGLLRHNMPLEYVIKVIKTLNLDEQSINTWKNGVIRTLKKFLDNGVVIPEKCPKCGGRLIMQDGCSTCIDCGHSKCS